MVRKKPPIDVDAVAKAMVANGEQAFTKPVLRGILRRAEVQGGVQAKELLGAAMGLFGRGKWFGPDGEQVSASTVQDAMRNALNGRAEFSLSGDTLEERALNAAPGIAKAWHEAITTALSH